MSFHRFFSLPLDSTPPDVSSQTHPIILRYRHLFRSFVRQVSAESPLHPPVPARGKRILVAGGTGFVGSELVQQLTRKGYEVLVVSRKKGAGLMTWDELLRDGLPEKTWAVVNLAGHNIMDPWYRWNDQFKKLVHDSRITPARFLSVAIQQVPRGLRPNVFIQITGTAVYPPHPTQEYDEKSILKRDGNGFLSQLVFDWEEAARLSSEVDDVRMVFVRPGVVLGRYGGLVASVFLPFFMGFGGPMGTGRQPMPWIHVKDLSGLIVHCVENDRVVGVLNGVAPELITNGDFARAFAKEMHRPAAIPTPAFVFQFVFGEERAGMIVEGQRVLPRCTLESGYKFRYPTIAEACKEFAIVNYKDADSKVP